MHLDYFKLPFEVHYSDSVEVTSFEFMSDVEVKQFSDIKILRKQQGVSFNPNFVCSENSGSELYCCIINGHDEVQPDWLCISSEDDVKLNYATSLKVVVDAGRINFEELSDEELDEDGDDYIDVEEMDYCSTSGYMAYELELSTPDYLVLDALGSRIKVNLQGYVLDDDGEATGERVFDPAVLQDDEKLQDYSSLNMWEATAEWVNWIITNEFPDDINLSLSSD
jgi:hypothetical protein